MSDHDAPGPPCPFVYANGSPCTGHIVRVEAYKADLCWSFDNGAWRLEWDQPRSHFHLFCSEKGDHAGSRRQDNPQMKFWFRELPPALQEVMLKG